MTAELKFNLEAENIVHAYDRLTVLIGNLLAVHRQKESLHDVQDIKAISVCNSKVSGAIWGSIA